ncbi:DUF1330 domain-containing protein [Vibrio lamellibrachiae]|uniref:DUF1330 domain-containing protein n=1 Tax=Vibrio lamellibrachiae TaxID=2910253 RepID=UPI003D0FF216
MNNSQPAYLVASLILPEGHASLVDYAKAAMPIFQSYGANVLITGTSEQEVGILEGNWSTQDAKLSLVQFPSMQHLKECMSSQEYLAIKHLRSDVIDTNFSLAIS